MIDRWNREVGSNRALWIEPIKNKVMFSKVDLYDCKSASLIIAVPMWVYRRYLRVDKCPFHSVNGFMFPEFDRCILSARPGPGGPPD